MPPIIDCRGLALRRHGATIVEDVTFAVDAGEWVAVTGANGAGKTTLLLGLLGLLRPAAGSVTIKGLSAEAARRRATLGYVPQRLRDAAELPIRVRDAVAIGRHGWPAGARRRMADRDAVAAAMETVGITGLAERPIGAVSGGERQRVELARVLAQDAPLLLLDEPGAGLDLGAREALFALIGDLCMQRGLTVLLVMHELAALPSGCCRALVLDRGRLVWDGETAGVFEPALLERVYGANAGLASRALAGRRGC